jgi:hypothetical protein
MKVKEKIAFQVPRQKAKLLLARPFSRPRKASPGLVSSILSYLIWLNILLE